MPSSRIAVFQFPLSGKYLCDGAVRPPRRIVWKVSIPSKREVPLWLNLYEVKDWQSPVSIPSKREVPLWPRNSGAISIPDNLVSIPSKREVPLWRFCDSDSDGSFSFVSIPSKREVPLWRGLWHLGIRWIKGVSIPSKREVPLWLTQGDYYNDSNSCFNSL